MLQQSFDENFIMEFKSNPITLNGGNVFRLTFAVIVSLHSLFHIFLFLVFVSAFHFGSYFQLKLQSFWQFVFFVLYFGVVYQDSYQIQKYSICDASCHHFHFSAVHYLSMDRFVFFFHFAMHVMRLFLFGFYFSILEH